MTTKLLVLKTCISLLSLVKLWDQLDFRWALRVLLYPWKVKKSFVGKWVMVVILVVMGQYRFLIQCFCSPLFLFDFLKKKVIYYFYFNFFLFVGSHEPLYWSLTQDTYVMKKTWSKSEVIHKIKRITANFYDLPLLFIIFDEVLKVFSINFWYLLDEFYAFQ